MGDTGAAVAIGGVWLRYCGGENDPVACVTVEVEVDGRWIEVIREAYGACFSHAISASGIRAAGRASGQARKRRGP